EIRPIVHPFGASLESRPVPGPDVHGDAAVVADTARLEGVALRREVDGAVVGPEPRRNGPGLAGPAVGRDVEVLRAAECARECGIQQALLRCARVGAATASPVTGAGLRPRALHPTMGATLAAGAPGTEDSREDLLLSPDAVSLPAPDVRGRLPIRL